MSLTLVLGTFWCMSTDRVEDREVDVFERLMRSSLKDECVNREGDIHGFCEAEEDIVDLLSNLRVHGYAYSVRISVYYRQPPSGAAKRTLCSCATFKSSIQISFFGSFILHGSNGQATSKIYKRVAVADHPGNIKVTQLPSPSSERQCCDHSSEPPPLVESVIDTQCIPRCGSPYH
ncbi:uncharacterized protein LOC126299357 [Schistocerca gregaria]|uniref:uncharacterized protein LOC126299357 n=1 Tax=Schistocerca gregaria TaxID=7010 RepID=UPI00211F1410|nr:uncharacterized protein LOC126299357 [Schistocerca gregaria]